MSVLGVAVGAGVHTFVATLGLSALLATSAVAFAIVKYLGAAYLIYLGIATIFEKSRSLQRRRGCGRSMVPVADFPPGPRRQHAQVHAGLVLLTFLPQFAAPGPRPVAPRIFALAVAAAVSGGRSQT